MLWRTEPFAALHGRIQLCVERVKMVRLWLPGRIGKACLICSCFASVPPPVRASCQRAKPEQEQAEAIGDAEKDLRGMRKMEEGNRVERLSTRGVLSVRLLC